MGVLGLRGGWLPVFPLSALACGLPSHPARWWGSWPSPSWKCHCGRRLVWALIGFPSAQRLIRLSERSSWARNGFRLTSSLAQNVFRLTSYYRGPYRLILGSRLICLFEHSSLGAKRFSTHSLLPWLLSAHTLLPWLLSAYPRLMPDLPLFGAKRLSAHSLLSSAQRLMRLFERSSGANRFTATRNWVNHFHSLSPYRISSWIYLLS